MHIGTLELITAVAFDVGLFLLVTGVLVLLDPPPRRRSSRRRDA